MKTQRIRQLQRFTPLRLVATLLVIVCVGCNTAHGFGKDMEKIYRALAKAVHQELSR